MVPKACINSIEKGWRIGRNDDNKTISRDCWILIMIIVKNCRAVTSEHLGSCYSLSHSAIVDPGVDPSQKD